MKKFLRIALLATGLFAGKAADAQTLVHYWNFNTVTSDTLPTRAIDATYSRIDPTKATVWYTSTPGTSSAYSSYFDDYINADSTTGVGQSWNARFGDPVLSGIRLRNPSDSMELLVYIPTTHYQNPVIKYVTEASSNGMKVQAFDYSTDSGSTWRTSALSLTADSPVATTWSSVTVNLNSTTDTTIRNNPRLVFRVTFRVNNTGTSGNDRIDNMTMEADTFIVTHSGVGVAPVASPEASYTLYPNPVTNTLTLSSDAEGAKSVMIRSMDGKTVFAGLANSKNIPLDVTTLASGTYFVTVKEATSGNSTTMKFIKQ